MALITTDVYTNQHWTDLPMVANGDKTFIAFLSGGIDLRTVYSPDESLETGSTEADVEVGTVHSPSIWWEAWTPGLSGNVAHMVWSDYADDELKYAEVDMSDGSIGTISTIVSAGTLAADARECNATVTVSKSGRVHIWWIDWDGTSGASLRHFYSDDIGGSGWTEGTADLDSDVSDTVSACALFAFPANTSDDDDCGLIIGPQDTTTAAYAYDASADTLDNRTVLQTRLDSWGNPWGFFNAAYSAREQKAYVAVIDDMNNTDIDGELYSVAITGTDSVTTASLGQWQDTATLGTGGDDYLHHPSICCDDVNREVYICYAYQAFQTNTTRVGRSVYDIAGASFGGHTRVDVSADDYRATTMPKQIPETVGGWIHFVYYDDDQTELAYDPTQSIEIVASQNVDASGLAATTATGAVALELTVTPSGTAATTATGTATAGLVENATPAGLGVVAATGTPAPELAIAPAGLAVAAAMGTPAAVPVQDLTPAGHAATVAFGTPLLELAVTPAALAALAAYGSPTPLLVFDVTPSGIAAAVATGTPAPELTVTPDGIAGTVATGEPSVSSGLTATPAGYAGAATQGVPGLILHVLPVSGAGISAEGTVSPRLHVHPDGLAAVATPGSPTTAFVALPAGLAATVATGSPGLELTATPEALAVLAAMGEPSILLVFDVEPSAFAATATPGTVALALTVTADGLAVVADYGEAGLQLIGGVQQVDPAGLGVEAVYGQPFLLVHYPALDAAARYAPEHEGAARAAAELAEMTGRYAPEVELTARS